REAARPNLHQARGGVVQILLAAGEAVRFMAELRQEILQAIEAFEDARAFQRLFAEVQESVDVRVDGAREDALQLGSGQHRDVLFSESLGERILPWRRRLPACACRLQMERGASK